MRALSLPIALALLLAVAGVVHAERGVSVPGAIHAAAANEGVPELAGVALGLSWCESRWDEDAEGDGGHSLGPFQIADFGLEADFRAMGGTDRRDPEQTATYFVRVLRDRGPAFVKYHWVHCARAAGL